MKKSKLIRSMISGMLAVSMIFGTAPAVYAEEETEVVSSYNIDILENANGTITIDANTASEGETVTVTAVANEGYTLTQVGYCTIDAEGKQSKIVEIEADENGLYTFAMPASDIWVGAAFQSGLIMADNKIGGTKENDYSIYVANQEAFLNVGDEKTSVYLSVDERFFDIEDITMRLEVRQYEDGYILVGFEEYSLDEMKELFADAKHEDGCYILDSVDIPINMDKTLNEGWNVYCTAQFTRPGWTDVLGAQTYRWGYTMTDSIIIGEGKAEPSPIVWLYNLDANSYRGALIRSILEDLGIKAGTVNNENLNQNIGYLVEWEGYEPVENPYNSTNYTVEYMLMGNLSEVQLDGLLAAMAENNIRVDLKSMPTAWTADKTFSELFDIMAEESEVLTSAIALDQMIYLAEEVDEETYGSSEYWAEFQATLADAIEALKTDVEETGEGAIVYINARNELEEIYLKITGRLRLTGDLELIYEKQENGTYKVSAKLISNLENPTYTYTWKPAASAEEAAAEYIIVAAEDLYKVGLEINGTDKTYGEMTAKLHVPADPAFEVVTSKNSLSVELIAGEAELNMPETLGYVVELYLDGEKVDAKEVDSAQAVVFENITEKTNYVVKVNSYNLIGRSNIIEKTVLAGLPYEDVSVNDWFYNAVSSNYLNGTMTGMDETHFGPYESLSRAQFALMLYRMLPEHTVSDVQSTENQGMENEPEVTSENPFADIVGDEWYAEAVVWAQANGIVTGYEDGNFGPADMITREQMAVMMYRYANYLKIDTTSEADYNDFVDADSVSEFAVDAMKWVVAEEIITGKDNGTKIDPQGITARAEAAAIIQRFTN